MQDWKDALSALTGVERQDEHPEQPSPGRKKRTGVVYSTNPHFEYSDGTVAAAATLPAAQQRLRVSMERAGRGGKTVTIVSGFIGADADLRALAKNLKQCCGVGGSVKEGDVIIQGDHRQRIIEMLKGAGYSQTK